MPHHWKRWELGKGRGTGIEKVNINTVEGQTWRTCHRARSEQGEQTLCVFPLLWSSWGCISFFHQGRECTWDAFLAGSEWRRFVWGPRKGIRGRLLRFELQMSVDWGGCKCAIWMKMKKKKKERDKWTLGTIAIRLLLCLLCGDYISRNHIDWDGLPTIQKYFLYYI